MARKPTGKPAGRPKKGITKEDFESLMTIQCTLSETAAFFDHKLGGCSEDTIERWCKRTYGESFAEISAKKRDLGRISLRRAGFEMAKKIPSVHIFYAKNYLGMTDRIEQVVTEVEDLTKLADMLNANETDN